MTLIVVCLQHINDIFSHYVYSAFLDFIYYELQYIYSIGKAAETTSEDKTSDLEENVTWDLKWSQDENAEIHGPYSSQQMHAWAKEGYFKMGAWVRRTGQQNQFYNGARVDFELYL